MRHSFTAGGIADLALLRYYYTQENYSDIDASGGLVESPDERRRDPLEHVSVLPPAQ